MNDNQRQSVAASWQPTKRAPTTTHVTRLMILLGGLTFAAAALFFDFAVARPGVAAEEEKLNQLVEARNRLTVSEGGFLRATDIHQALGSAPTWIEKHPEEGFEVEYYCWWGYLPLINMRRHYLAIVYVGEGANPVFRSHHRNQRPPRDALPMPFVERQPLGIAAADLNALPLKDRPHLRRPVAAVWIEPERLLAVANERSGGISIVDFRERRVLNEISVGERLADISADGSGRRFFAIDPLKCEIIVLAWEDHSLRVANRHPTSTYPVSIAVSPQGDRISVVTLWSRRLALFGCSNSGDSLVVNQLAEISLPFNPREQRFSSENVVLVNDAFANRSCEIDLATHTVTMRTEMAVLNPEPSHRRIKGIDAWSEISRGQERIVGAHFSISLGPTSTLSPEDRGEELFYSRKLSPTGQSCHDCHPFGHTTYDLADTLADGTTGTPKRILTLLGVHQTYPWAWNGAIGELDDQVRKSLETTLHVRNVTPQQVVDINSFLHTLAPPPPLEPVTDSPEDRAQLDRGRSIFDVLGCAKCHVPEFNYTSGEVFDVGPADEAGLSRFNPPSLRGVGQGYSFFHDGRAKTLAEVFTNYGHQLSRELSEMDLADLLRFLRSL